MAAQPERVPLDGPAVEAQLRNEAAGLLRPVGGVAARSARLQQPDDACEQVASVPLCRVCRPKRGGGRVA